MGNLSLGLGFSGANGTRVPDVPYAYLKYIVYRADSSIAEEGEHLISSSANSNWEELALSTVIEEDGYIKVFALNEDAVNVWFDDFSIVHKQSPIAQQTDYYPFGLEIAGTQYNREEWLVNRFNTFQEQEKDLTLDWYQFKWRNHQAEIGRFFNIDPLSEKYLHYSTYAFSGNLLVTHRELEGLEPIVSNGVLTGYNVKEGQGPTQIAADINNPKTQAEYGYGLSSEFDWRSIVDNPANKKYFDVPFMSSEKKIWDIGYYSLNWHVGDKVSIFTEEGNIGEDKSEQGVGSNVKGITLATLGFALNMASDMYDPAKYGFWVGKNFKLYSNDWGGNGSTGGKLKFSKKTGTKLKWAGRVLGAYNAFVAWDDYTEGRIDLTWLIAEEASNALATFGNHYGAAWGIGWEIGRQITLTEVYVDFKINYWMPLRKKHLGY